VGEMFLGVTVEKVWYKCDIKDKIYHDKHREERSAKKEFFMLNIIKKLIKIRLCLQKKRVYYYYQLNDFLQHTFVHF
jgi:hypothetical protein